MNKLESFRKTTLNNSDLWYIESTVNFKMWATLEVREIVRSFRLMRKTHRSSHPSHHLIQIQLVFGCSSLDRLHLQLLSLPSNMLTNHKTKLHMKQKKLIIPHPKNPPNQLTAYTFTSRSKDPEMCARDDLNSRLGKAICTAAILQGAIQTETCQVTSSTAPREWNGAGHRGRLGKKTSLKHPWQVVRLEKESIFFGSSISDMKVGV